MSKSNPCIKYKIIKLGQVAFSFLQNFIVSLYWDQTDQANYSQICLLNFWETLLSQTPKLRLIRKSLFWSCTFVISYWRNMKQLILYASELLSYKVKGWKSWTKDSRELGQCLLEIIREKNLSVVTHHEWILNKSKLLIFSLPYIDRQYI